MKSLQFLSKSSFSTLQTSLYYNGVFHPSSTHFAIQNPASEASLASVASATPTDIDLAVQAASLCFPQWSTLPPKDRSNALYRLSEIMTREADNLAMIESQNTGKPYHFARKNDIPAAIEMLRYYAGYADKFYGKTIQNNSDVLCLTMREAIGVVAQILPWNFPLAGLAAKIAPALIAGCTVVVKPSELTPLSALYLSQFFNECGFPNGSINIVPGTGDIAGECLMKHPLVNKVAFTGSTAVGLHIMRNCHQNGLKKVGLELGGKSAYIVLPDADIDQAVRQAQGANFYNSGQICIAGSRVFVHESIYESFVAKTLEITKERVVGDPMDEKTDIGPLISEKQRGRFEHYVGLGVSEGAKLIIGGGRDNRFKKGFYVQPTVFKDVEDGMTIAKEEVFGPVMSILRFKTIEEVISRANNTQYGLVAGVMTRDIGKALDLAGKLKVGNIWVNCYGVFESGMPFGGVKNSGIGKEHGEAGILEYLNEKTVMIKRD